MGKHVPRFRHERPGCNLYLRYAFCMKDSYEGPNTITIITYDLPQADEDGMVFETRACADDYDWEYTETIALRRHKDVSEAIAYHCETISEYAAELSRHIDKAGEQGKQINNYDICQ